jgi:hypothetical protein
MHQRHTQNLSLLTTNHDDYLGTMRSSRINPKTTFDHEHQATLTKNQKQHNSKFFNSNNEYIETVYTTKKLIFTPIKKHKTTENENDSKQTVVDSNTMSKYNKYNNPFLVNTCHKFENEDNNKENSNIKSNLFSSQSPLSSKKESDSNTSSGFKMPIKKLEFSNNLKDGKYESVRVNLQKTFNNDTSHVLPKINQERRQFHHPLISSSESSSQDDTFNSKNENISSNEKEIMLENIRDNKMTSNSQLSNLSVPESLLEGLARKTFFNIPREKTNDEKYKILALKKIRKSTHKDNKSTSKLDVNMKNSQEDYPESMLQCNLLNRRRKIIHSVKKICASEIALIDPVSSDTKKFRIFKDCDIGINQDWQKYLKESKADEDVPTDEELLSNATSFVHNNIQESITYLYNNRDSNMVNNICYLRKK